MTDASPSAEAALRACEARRECDRYEQACTLLLLAGASAHEVSNPLNTLLLNAELAASRSSERPVRVALEKVLAEAERCTEASRRLLEFAPEPVHAPRPLSAERLLRDACSLARGELAQAGARLVDDIGPLPEAALDAVAVRTALLVLMRDAAIGGAAGTTVRARGRADGGDILLGVEDDAPDLPIALVQRNCNPFRASEIETARRVLGIGVAQQVAARHGGTLEVHGREGGGTRVDLRLPV